MGRHGRCERYPLPELVEDWPEPARAFLAERLDRLRYNALRRPEARRQAEMAARRWWALGKGGVPKGWPTTTVRYPPGGQERAERFPRLRG